MRALRATALIISIAFLISSAAVAKSTSKTSAKATKHNNSAKSSKSKSKKTTKKNWKAKGQKSIDNQRTREIQEALIREHYLNGEPTGNMDAATKAALTKLQGDNGWQTKVVPDSRALIKLGLGPNQSNLLNPDTAALSSAVASSKNQR